MVIAVEVVTCEIGNTNRRITPDGTSVTWMMALWSAAFILARIKVRAKP